MKNFFFRLKLLFIPTKENHYQPTFLKSKFLDYCIFILVLLKIICLLFIFNFPKTIFFADISRIFLLELTNKEREMMGLSLLKENQKLNEIAYLKAKDMFENNYFSHYSPRGYSPWYWFEKVGYNYQYAGENLAIDFFDAEEAHQAWNNSASHRINIINPHYKEIGLAAIRGNFENRETIIVVQVFGTLTSQPITQATISPETSVKKEAQIKPEIEQIKEIESETERLQEELKKIIPPIETEEKKEETIISESIPSSIFIREEKISPLFKSPPKNLEFNILSFIAKNYDDITQKIFLSVLIIVIISLLLKVFIKINIQFKDLIFKGIFYSFILLILFLLDKEIIISLIPHNFGIL